MSNDLIKKANAGDKESQYELGKAYTFGKDGFPVNLTEAIKWLDLSGDTYPQALKFMIGISLGALGEDGKNPKRNNPWHRRQQIFPTSGNISPTSDRLRPSHPRTGDTYSFADG